MTTLLFFAAIAFAVTLVFMNDKMNALKRENHQLKQQVEQLWAFFRGHVQQEYLSSQKKNAVQQPTTPTAQQQPAPFQAPTPPAPAAQRPMPQPPVQTYQPPVGQTPSPAGNYAPVRPQPAAVKMNTQQPTAPAVKAAPKKEGTPGKMENWFGQNVLGIAASVLFFIGLIVFAVWIYNDIPDAVKVILMYAISAGTAAAGILLTKRRRNNFTLILSGCGSGLLFISILLTHIYFGYLNDVATFGLLLIWLIAALALSKLLDSTLISIVAHVGMGISLCFAYGAGLRDDKLVILLVYQAASIAVVLIGNLLCCRKTYRFGLFLSVVTTLVAESYMSIRFIGGRPLSDGPFPLTALPVLGVAASFFAQFLCVSFLSYLLAVSTTRLKNSAARMGIHIASKVLWVIALCQNVLTVVFRLGYAGAGDTTIAWLTAARIMAAVGIGILLVHATLSLFMNIKLNFDERLTTLSVIVSGALSAILLFVVWSERPDSTNALHLPCIIAPAVLLTLAGIHRKNKAYTLAANIMLGFEWLLMANCGFYEMTQFGTIALPLFYMALYTGLVWLQWGFRPAEIRAKQFSAIRIFTYFFLQGTTAIILLGSEYRYRGISLLLALTAFNILLNVFRYDRGKSRAPAHCMKATEVLLLTINAIAIASFSCKDTPDCILYVLLAVFTAFYAFCRLPITLGRGSMMEDIYTGIKFTVLTMAFLQGFTYCFEQASALTLVAMGTFLISMIVGYLKKSRGLVHYSLIAAMIWMLRLVYDFVTFDSLQRLISLFGAGLALFVMQVMYEKLDAKKPYSYSDILRVIQHLLLTASSFTIAFMPHAGTAETSVSILLTLLSIAWAFWRTPKSLGRFSRQEDVLEGIKLTVLVLTSVHGYTDWFKNAYVLSLVCMLTALVCVIAGFARRTGGLRLYGLVLTMVCVLKLVTWDVAGLETLLRILSLIGGGVICFAISAIYSYSVKRFSALAKGTEGAGALPDERPMEE